MNVAVLSIALVVVVVGCVLDGPKGEARISNVSGVAVEIHWAGPGAGGTLYATIPPGQVHGVFEWVNRCAPAGMVARTVDGQELSRTAPLCHGDVWVIEGPGAAAPT